MMRLRCPPTARCGPHHFAGMTREECYCESARFVASAGQFVAPVLFPVDAPRPSDYWPFPARSPTRPSGDPLEHFRPFVRVALSALPGFAVLAVALAATSAASAAAPPVLWQGVERIGLQCLVATPQGVDSGPLHARLCDSRARARRARRAPSGRDRRARRSFHSRSRHRHPPAPRSSRAGAAAAASSRCRCGCSATIRRRPSCSAPRRARPSSPTARISRRPSSGRWPRRSPRPCPGAPIRPRRG